MFAIRLENQSFFMFQLHPFFFKNRRVFQVENTADILSDHFRSRLAEHFFRTIIRFDHRSVAIHQNNHVIGIFAQIIVMLTQGFLFQFHSQTLRFVLHMPVTHVKHHAQSCHDNHQKRKQQNVPGNFLDMSVSFPFINLDHQRPV